MPTPRKVFSLAMVFAVMAPRSLTGQIEGIVIGFGAGPGALRVQPSLNFPGARWTTDYALATHLRLGLTVAEGLSVYYSSRFIFHVAEQIRNAGEYDLVVGGLTGLGATWSLPSVPMLHVNGAAGLAVWAVASDGPSNTASLFGPGVSAGVGMDFLEVLMLDFDVVAGRPRDEFGTLNMFNAQLTLSIASR